MPPAVESISRNGVVTGRLPERAFDVLSYKPTRYVSVGSDPDPSQLTVSLLPPPSYEGEYNYEGVLFDQAAGSPPGVSLHQALGGQRLEPAADHRRVGLQALGQIAGAKLPGLGQLQQQVDLSVSDAGGGPGILEKPKFTHHCSAVRAKRTEKILVHRTLLVDLY